MNTDAKISSEVDVGQRADRNTSRDKSWWQFSLKSFLIVSVVAAGIISWGGWLWTSVRQAELEQEIVTRFQATGLVYRHQIDAQGNIDPHAPTPGVSWLKDWLGENVFARLTSMTIFKNDDLLDLERVGNVTQLRTLSIERCNNLISLKGVNRLRSLEKLYVKSSSLATVASLADSPKLKSLSLRNCIGLRSIEGAYAISNLERLDLTGCTELKTNSLQGLRELNLKSLQLGHCRSLTDLRDLRGLDRLEELDVSCHPLKQIEILDSMENLRKLDLHWCLALDNLYGIESLRNLEEVDLEKCILLTNVDAMSGLESLRKVNLSECDALTNIDGLGGVTNLEVLDLSNCAALNSIDALAGLSKLEYINLSGCRRLAGVGSLLELPNLRHVDLWNCSLLTEKQVERIRIAHPSAQLLWNKPD